MSSSFEYVLPVIRGIQSGREYYVSMCPVRFLPKLLPLSEEELSPELRSHRLLNSNRIPEITRYLLDNPQDYTFGAIAASIDAEITFEPIGTEGESRKMGRLRVPMDARFTINDGNHRRVAFEMALKENPELGYETVPLILFLDIGLQRSQQKFADLNRYTVPLDPSLSILYDHRDAQAQLVREVVKRVEVFRCLTEMERSTLSTRSSKLFTLSSLYQATMVLLENSQELEREKQVERSIAYWQAVSQLIPEWELVLKKKAVAAEVRQNFVHCHAIALTALGEVGKTLWSTFGEDWEKHLSQLKAVNWSVSNPDWQGQILCKGGVSKSKTSISWLENYLKDLFLKPVGCRK